MTRFLVACLLTVLLPAVAAAQDKSFVLALPEALVENGFAQYLLPRFSLKTGVRITRVAPDEPHDAAFGTEGKPVMQGAGAVWSFSATDQEHAQRFARWLASAVGQNTIQSFTIDGQPVYTTSVRQAPRVAEVGADGDAATGERKSVEHCGRCHVVSVKKRGFGIGSTPSFAVLRTFPDWRERFETFYVRKPHAAFTQIEDVTLPFDASLPSPIAPVRMTLDDVEAIVAYVKDIAPADLGAPIRSQ